VIHKNKTLFQGCIKAVTHSVYEIWIARRARFSLYEGEVLCPELSFVGGVKQFFFFCVR